MSLFSRRRLNFEEALAKQREKLLAGEDRVVRKLVRAYAVVDDTIKRELDAVNKKIAQARATGTEVSQHWLFQQERFRQMLAAVQDQVSKYAGSSETLSIERMREVVQLGLFDSAEIARATGIRGGFVRLQAKELEHIVGAFYDGSPLRKLFGQFGGQATKAASKAFVRGIGLGQNPREIGKQIAGDIEDLTLDRAVRIARTESMRAYTTAQAENYRANSDVVTGMRIMAAIDARTCPMCWARHGTILPLDAPFHRHPGCRCTLVPVTGFEDDLGIDMRTGDQIMRSRGVRYAEQVLGKERAQLWWEGRVQMADFFRQKLDPTWGPGLLMTTLTDLRQIAAHNAGRLFDVPQVFAHPLVDALRIAGSTGIKMDASADAKKAAVSLGIDLDEFVSAIVGHEMTPEVAKGYKATATYYNDVLSVRLYDHEQPTGRPRIDVSRYIEVKGTLVDHDHWFTWGEELGGGIYKFAGQVQIYRRIGKKTIKTLAGRGYNMNGYYTWPRFGFDAAIPPRLVHRLPVNLQGAKRLSDLMKTQEGRDWWKSEGIQMPMKFDLRDGSTSMKTLEEYLEEKKPKSNFAAEKPPKKKGKQSDETKFEWPPELDEEDEKILDRIWDRRGQEPK